MLALNTSERPPRVHFMGIGGTAMVAGARLALEAGWEVRGSDNPLYPPTSLMVEALQVPVATGYGPENLDWDPDVVIVGNVLSRGNPEVEAVLERGLHYISLPEWLKDVVLRRRKPLVLTGTHGKTTTTAIAAYLLDRTGHPPGFLIGGQPLDFPHSARLGAEGAPFVIEGDEYDTAFFDKRAKFFHYLPHIAVVTSLEYDHGDIYNSVEEIELAFQRMLRQIPRSGHLVLCADAPRALALREESTCNVTTYGFGGEADWRIRDATQGLEGQQFTLHHDDESWGPMETPLTGRHNLLNTVAAIVATALHGVPIDAIAEVLPHFKGIKRRMEIFHKARGLTFIDDFAHHPTAIRETIAAAKARWSGTPLTVLFEPRSNTTTTNRFQDEIADALLEADQVWIGPIHRADSIAPEDRLDRQAIVDLLAHRNVTADYSDDIDEIMTDLSHKSGQNGIILILSNGAFGGIYDRIKEAFPEA